MTIEKFVYPAVAALTLASVASVPSAASAQASPGASDNTGTAVALSAAGAAAVGLFALTQQGSPSTDVVEGNNGKMYKGKAAPKANKVVDVKKPNMSKGAKAARKANRVVDVQR